MTLGPPDWGEPWQQVWDLLVWVSTGGSAWPEADEDRIRQLAQAWRDAGASLNQALVEASTERNALAESWGGPSGLAFQAEFSKVVDQALPKFAQLAQQVAQEADQAALDIEYEKLTVLIAVITCCLEIFAIIVLSFFTFGAALAAAAGPIGIARMAIAAALRMLLSRAAGSLGRLALREAVLEGLQELATDLTAQGIQAGMGNRSDWDADRTLWSAGAGAGAGALAAGTGPLANILGRRTPDNPLGSAIRTGIDGIHEAGVETVTNATVNGLRTGDWSIDTDGFANSALAEGVRGRISEGRDDALERLGQQIPVLPTPTPVTAPVAPTGLSPAATPTTGPAPERDSGGTGAGPVGGTAPPGTSGTGQSGSPPGTGQPRSPSPAQPGPSGTDPSRPSGPDPSRPSGPDPSGLPGSERPGQPGVPDSGQPVPGQPGGSGPGQPGGSGPGQPDASGVGGAGRPAAPEPSGPPPPPPDPVPPDRSAERVDQGRPHQPAPSAGPGAGSSTPTSGSTGTGHGGLTGPVGSTPPVATSGYLPPAGVAPAAVHPTGIAAHAGNPGGHVPTAGSPSLPGSGGPAGAGPSSGAGTQGAGTTGSAPGPATTGSAAVSPPTGPASGSPSSGSLSSGGPSSSTSPGGGSPGGGSPGGSGPVGGHSGTSMAPAGADGRPIGASDQSSAGTGFGLAGVAAVLRPADQSGSRRAGVPSTDGPTRPRPGATQSPGTGDDDLDPASAWDERELSGRIPVDEQRSPVLHPDPRHPSRWVGYLNDGGPARPGRATNCTDTVRAFLSTWYGRPSVAGALNQDLSRGVPDGTARIQRWLGADFVQQGAGAAGLDAVGSQLLIQGHGAAAVIISQWTDGGSHMWVAVNHTGTVVWVEPQTGRISDEMPLYQGQTDQVWALPLDANGEPVSPYPDGELAAPARPEQPAVDLAALAARTIDRDDAAARVLVRLMGRWAEGITQITAGTGFAAAIPDDQRQRLVEALVDHRRRLYKSLPAELGVRLFGVGSSNPDSDIDLEVRGPDAGRRLLAAEQHLTRVDPQWRSHYRMGVLVHSERVAGSVDALDRAPPERAATLRQELFRTAETLVLARRLRFASGPAERAALLTGLSTDLQEQVRQLADSSETELTRLRTRALYEADRHHQAAVAASDPSTRARHLVGAAREQLVADYADDEAYVSVGGKRRFAFGAQLERITERRQAVLDQLMQIAHVFHESSGGIDSLRRYETWKYVLRVGDVLDSSTAPGSWRHFAISARVKLPDGRYGVDLVPDELLSARYAEFTAAVRRYADSLRSPLPGRLPNPNLLLVPQPDTGTSGDGPPARPDTERPAVQPGGERSDGERSDGERSDGERSDGAGPAQPARRRPPEVPGRQPGPGGPARLVGGAEAVRAVRANLRAIPAGFDLTGERRHRRCADALRPEPGVVKIVLRGQRGGEVGVGDVRMLGGDFVHAVTELVQSGDLDLGTDRVVLVGSYSGLAPQGRRSLASMLARRLLDLGRRHEVTGADAKVWSFLDGTAVVAEPDPRDSSQPKHPPDGAWRTFAPSGLRIGSSRSASRPTAAPTGPTPTGPTATGPTATGPTPTGPTPTGPTPTTGPAAAGPSAAAAGPPARPLLPPDLRDHRHLSGDLSGTYRTDDRRLHRYDDRPYTYRDDETGRLHHERDSAGTYRDEVSFALRSARTDEVVRDPLLARSRPVPHRAVAGPPGPARSRPAREVVPMLALQGMRLEHLRRGRLNPLMTDLGIADLSQLAEPNVTATFAELLARPANPPSPAQMTELAAVVRQHHRLESAVRQARAEAPQAVARRILAEDFGIDGSAELTGGRTGPRPPGAFAVAGFDPDNQRLVVLETGRTSGSRHLLQDGSIAERGTPAYVRDVLETSRELHEHLRQHPELLDALHRALARGELTVQAYRVEVDVPGHQQVSVRSTPLDLSGLDLTGVADRLPARSSAVDPGLGHRLQTAAQQVAGRLTGAPGIQHVAVPDPQVVEIRPQTGAPYRLNLRTAPHGPGEEAFALHVGPDREHDIEFFHDQLDGLDQASLNRVLAGTLLYAHTRVIGAASAGETHALVDQPVSVRRLRLTDQDAAILGTFEAMAVLLPTTTGAERTRLRAEIRDFIQRYGLRDGFPGGDERVELARERLSTSAYRLLTEERTWTLDPDPAVAVARKALSGTLFDPTVALITPVPAGRGKVFRVLPAGWAKPGRVAFTVELRSGAVPNGRGIEIRNTAENRHFDLVVDPALLDHSAGAAPALAPTWAQFRNQLRAVIQKKIAEQAARPPEVSRRWRDRVIASAPAATGAATMAAVAAALGVPALAVKGAVVAGAEMITQGGVNRRSKLDKAEREQDRRLALRTDRTGIEDGGLQRLVDRGFVEAAELARGTAGRPDLVVPGPPTPAPPPAPSSSPAIDDDDARALRRRVRVAIEQIDQDRKKKPVEHLLRARHLGEDRYRLRIKGEGNDARVRVEVADTADRTKIEVKFDDPAITFRVPPDLARSSPDDVEQAVRAALKEVAGRQEKVSLAAPEVVGHLEKGATSTGTGVLPSVPVGNLALSHLGEVLGESAVARSIVQVFADRAAGRRDEVLRDLRERHDSAYSTRLPGGQRRPMANQIVALARGGESIAQAIESELAGTAPATTGSATTGTAPATTGTAPATTGSATTGSATTGSATTGSATTGSATGGSATGGAGPTPAGTEQAIDAAARAIQRVNRRHRHRFERDHDAERDPGTRVFRSDRIGIKRDVSLTLTFGTVEGNRTVVPTARRLKRGRFEFTVNVDAAPDEIQRTIEHVCDNILFDREHPLPRKRRLLEDYLPTGVGLAGAAAIAALSGPLWGLMTGVGAVAHLGQRWSARFHQIRVNDIALRKAFDTEEDDVCPADLRRSLDEQHAAVQGLEQRVRQLEERLAQDPRTAAQVVTMRGQLGAVPEPDLLAEVAREVAAARQLPRGGRIEPVAGAEHTFRFLFRGAKGRPESLTFELGTGQTDGGTLMAYRVNSDVAHMLRVDPTGTPGEIVAGVHAWLRQEVDRLSAMPVGLPGGRSRWTKFGADATGQSIGTAASIVVGATTSNPAVTIGQVLSFSGAKEASNISFDSNEAVLAQTRTELRKRFFGTAPEEQLAVFTFDTEHLRRRTVSIFHRLQQLERISETLPEPERPAPFQDGPVTLPDRPVLFGD
ncbi:toxin glutamine deamidase domain-containing protein [Plantactinospora sp. CA-294935]|uniref:toxin glutamine deamidase domain-containing protein n=1 Tax=Plantactinospora sp. CA-294935 TaxID=3240012 RepID=UPI003D935F24